MPTKPLRRKRISESSAADRRKKLRLTAELFLFLVVLVVSFAVLRYFVS